MNDIEQDILKLQHLDPIRLARQKTDSAEDDGETLFEAVRQQRKLQERMAMLAGEMADIYKDMPWDRYKAALQQQGFKTVLTQYYGYTFSYPNDPQTGRVETHVAANPNRKLLTFANSFNDGKKETLGGGYIYGVFDRTDLTSEQYARLLESSEGIFTGDGTDMLLPFSFEITAQPFTQLANLSEIGAPLVNWQGRRTDCFFLLNLNEWKSPYNDHDQITEKNWQEILAASPPDVREFIGV